MPQELRRPFEVLKEALQDCSEDENLSAKDREFARQMPL